MSKAPKIVAFAGSTRKGSYNKKILRIAAEAARKEGVEITIIDLKDYPMPLYDGDLEEREGLPENAKRFKKLLIEHDGILIASPEYNSSITGVLKNSIDWASRPEPDEKPLVAFSGKTAAIISASIGALGGLRSLVTLRSILGNINVLVIPEQKAIPFAETAFNEEDTLKDQKMQEDIERIGRKLSKILLKLYC